ARELGIPRFRLLSRDQLIAAIEERGGTQETEPEAEEEAPEAEEEAGAEEATGAEDEPDAQEGTPEADEAPTAEPQGEKGTGELDRMPQGYGFLRLSGVHEGAGDVYVSASQIRRCELRPGDEVTGPAREPRRGERHRALVRVNAVNGHSPEEKR